MSENIILLNFIILVIYVVFAILNKEVIPVILVPILIFYWTFYGLWSLVHSSPGNTSIAYEYYLGPISNDDYLFKSLAIYSVFYISLIIPLLFSSKIKYPKRNNRELYIYRRTFWAFVTMSLAFDCFYLFAIAMAYLNNQLPYIFIRSGQAFGNLYFTINFIRDTAFYLGVFLIFETNSYSKSTIFVLLIDTFVCIASGDRNILVVAVLLAINVSAQRKGFIKTVKELFIPLGLVLVAVGLTASLRAAGVGAYFTSKDGGFRNLYSAILGSLNSNEKYAASMSMYYSLLHNVAPRPLTSFAYLLSTLVPSAIGIGRPDNIYNYYTSSIGYYGTMGITLHYATGFYLNSGIVGVLTGAMGWGTIILLLSMHSKRMNNSLSRFALSIFCASTVQMIRAGGLESYKSSIVLNLLVPLVIIVTTREQIYEAK